MRNELIKAPLTESWALLRKEWRGLIGGLIKIDLLTFAAAIAGIILVVLAGFLLSGISLIAAVALMALIAIPLIIVVQAIRSIGYNFIDSAWSKKRISYSDVFQENLLPVAGWAVVMFLIRLAVAIPFLALFFLAVLGSQGGDGRLVYTLAELLFRIFLGIALAIVDLFLQFAIFEIVLSRSGVLQGFGKSFGLVRKNLVETVLFSFILWVIEAAVSVPILILVFALVFFGVLGLAIPGIGLIALAIIALLVIPIFLVFSALTRAITVTSQYRYWGRARVR